MTAELPEKVADATAESSWNNWHEAMPVLSVAETTKVTDVPWMLVDCENAPTVGDVPSPELLEPLLEDEPPLELDDEEDAKVMVNVLDAPSTTVANPLVQRAKAV